jgi:hypothetical protein
MFANFREKFILGLGNFFHKISHELNCHKCKRKSKKLTVCDIFDNPPILNIKFGVGAARSIIILVKPEPHPDVAPAPKIQAPTAPAPNLMFNLGAMATLLCGNCKR